MRDKIDLIKARKFQKGSDMKNLPGGLISAGLAMLVLGVFKRTTVETGWGTVHNIGLMQQQDNLLFIGAVALVAGLILKSGADTREATKTEDESVEKEDAERAEQKVEEVFVKVDQNLQKGKDVVAQIPIKLNRCRENFFVRVGAAVGVSLLLMGASILYVVALPITSLLLLVLAIWPINFQVGMKRVMLVASVIASFGVLLNLMMMVGGEDAGKYLITGLIVNGLLIWGYVRFRKY